MSNNPLITIYRKYIYRILCYERRIHTPASTHTSSVRTMHRIVGIPTAYELLHRTIVCIGISKNLYIYVAWIYTFLCTVLKLRAGFLKITGEKIRISFFSPFPEITGLLNTCVYRNLRSERANLSKEATHISCKLSGPRSPHSIAFQRDLICYLQREE